MLKYIFCLMFLSSCHQYGVLLQQEKPYIGDIKTPTFTVHKDRSNVACDKFGCVYSGTIWITVINPTKNALPIFIVCKTILNNYEGIENVVKIKPFTVGSKSRRKLLVEVGGVIGSQLRTVIRIYCDMRINNTVKRSALTY